MGVLGEFKRGVDVAHGDWFGVREGTHLLGVHPLHPNMLNSCPHTLKCRNDLSYKCQSIQKHLINLIYT
ncbi:hypothetical protein Hanom_Chr07g00663271 [Helianthus anomalus]